MNSTTAETIFIVEDDAKLIQLIQEYLEGNGYRVITESDGSFAAQRILEENPALVILDVMLPGKDGRIICREIRDQYTGVIVMVSALGDDIDQITGLELGADEYITKPIHPRLLLSRIQALLRFAVRAHPNEQQPKTRLSSRLNQPLTIGKLHIHAPSREVLVNGEPAELTSTQFDLLLYLAEHAGRAISRDELYCHFYGIEYDGTSRTIDLSILRLRERIGDNGKHPNIIKSIRGEGYLMVKPS